MREKLLLGVAVLLALIAIVRMIGCEEPVELGTVEGTVTYHGQPLKTQDAAILFVSEDRRTSIQANIKDDGSYKVSVKDGWGLPPGTYRVAIRPPLDATAVYEDVPLKYRDPDSSGLEMVLTAAGQNYSVDMK